MDGSHFFQAWQNFYEREEWSRGPGKKLLTEIFLANGQNFWNQLLNLYGNRVLPVGMSLQVHKLEVVKTGCAIVSSRKKTRFARSTGITPSINLCSLDVGIAHKLGLHGVQAAVSPPIDRKSVIFGLAFRSHYSRVTMSNLFAVSQDERYNNNDEVYCTRKLHHNHDQISTPSECISSAPRSLTLTRMTFASRSDG